MGHERTTATFKDQTMDHLPTRRDPFEEVNAELPLLTMECQIVGFASVLLIQELDVAESNCSECPFVIMFRRIFSTLQLIEREDIGMDLTEIGKWKGPKRQHKEGGRTQIKEERRLTEWTKQRRRLSVTSMERRRTAVMTVRSFILLSPDLQTEDRAKTRGKGAGAERIESTNGENDSPKRFSCCSIAHVKKERFRRQVFDSDLLQLMYSALGKGAKRGKVPKGRS
ncbi:hypothetical protein GPALN_012788 [Globodera pallida]|nr:hypothetical protein GPALN_012788 [Globodera pallida]